MTDLSPEDVATRLSVSASYVYHNWRVLGVPFVRLGGKLRLTEQAYEAWRDSLPLAQ